MNETTTNQGGQKVNNQKTYKIVRFQYGQPAKTIATDLTYSEVKEYFNNGQPHRGKGWTEGFANPSDDFSKHFGYVPREVK